MKSILENKKILITIGIGIGLTFILSFFIYLPSRNKVNELKQTLQNIENEISQIRTVPGTQSHNLPDILDYLRERRDKIFKRLSSQEEQALKILSDSAHRFRLDVVSVRPERKLESKDESGNPLCVGKYKCYEMPITISMRGRYKDIGNYLGRLNKEDLPVLIKVEKLEIFRKDEELPKLEARIHLLVYFLEKS